MTPELAWKLSFPLPSHAEPCWKKSSSIRDPTCAMPPSVSCCWQWVESLFSPCATLALNAEMVRRTNPDQSGGSRKPHDSSPLGSREQELGRSQYCIAIRPFHRVRADQILAYDVDPPPPRNRRTTRARKICARFGGAGGAYTASRAHIAVIRAAPT